MPTVALQQTNNQIKDIEDFFDLHFPHSDHHGMIHLWAKSRYKNQKMYRLAYGESEYIIDKLCNSKIMSAHQDYYLTANTMSAGTRDRDGLFSLNNIVLDIDNHAPGQDYHITQHQYGSFINIYQDMMMDASGRYIPNTIVCTGRGMQLWFSIEQIGYKRLDVWERLCNEIIRQTEELLNDHKDILQGLTIDTGASRNAAGLFRAPWSYNKKSKTYAEFEIIHDEQIDAMEAVKELKRSDRKSSRVVNFATATNGAALRRHNSLIKLVKLRQDRGQVIERDNILFCDYCLWAGIYQDNAEIMIYVKALNALFKDPMPEKELLKNLSTATRKRYQLKNETIINRLQITAEEQELVGFFAKGTDREVKREAARKAKADRNKKILSMYASGSTQEEIADKLDISRRTVCNVLEAAGARKCDAGKTNAQKASNQPENEADDKKTIGIIKAQNMASDDAEDIADIPSETEQKERDVGADNLCKNRPIYGGGNAPALLRERTSSQLDPSEHGFVLEFPPVEDALQDGVVPDPGKSLSG